MMAKALKKNKSRENPYTKQKTINNDLFILQDVVYDAHNETE